MNIKVKINKNCNDELILIFFKDHLIKQGITNVSLSDNKLILKNIFFNKQGRMNPFAYIKEGSFHIHHFDKYKILHYTYHSFKFPLYFCTLLLCLSFVWTIFRFFTLIFAIVFLINFLIYHKKQKNFINKKISQFTSENQI